MFTNREKNGRWTFGFIHRANAWARETFRRMAWCAVGIALIATGITASEVTGNHRSVPEIVRVAVPHVEAKESFESKLEAVKWGVVDRLEKCESAGRKETDGIVVIDNNQAGTLRGEDVFSYGPLQWKVKTVKHFAGLRDGKTMTSKEAIMLALDGKEARELAYFAIWETKGGIFHWLNCANKHGLAQEIELVKKLEN